MDENSALIEQILREQEEEERVARRGKNDVVVYPWQTVSYQKRNRKSSKPTPESAAGDPNGLPDGGAEVFRSVELRSEERRRRAAESQVAAAADAADAASPPYSDDDGEEVAAVENGGAEVKKAKPKKAKRVKVSVAEAASKIDDGDLGAFLAEITVSYESQQDVQLMRFADYYRRAFEHVGGAQFPWLKTFKESSVEKLVDIPLSHISENVYKTSTEWLGQRSSNALVSLLEWSLDRVIADLESHQVAAKGSKKVAQQVPSKSQVSMFVVLAMVLRRKPDVLISFLPLMKKTPKFQGQEKLPLIVWLIAQASLGDLTVGLYMWAHFLLPLLGSKSACNPQSRDLILQLVERILSAPKARTILLNGSAKKGERLVPPSALDILMRVTFPPSSARVKATERFEAIYPVLKEVALAGSPGSKAMKQLAQQIFDFAIKAVKEDIPDLSKEASDIFFWCLKQNPECYKQWDEMYLENLEASIVILRRQASEWKQHSDKHLASEPLKETLKSFSQQNNKELSKEGDSARNALVKDAEKYIKLILGKSSSGGLSCMKIMVLVPVALAVGAVLSQTLQS